MSDVQLERDLLKLRVSLETHVQANNKRNQELDSRIDKLIDIQEKNTETVNELIEETRGIVELHKDFQSLARVGIGLQRFAGWIAKFGLAGATIAGALHWFSNNLEKLGN